MTNANTTFVGVLTSREFFAIRGLPTAFALGSLYGTTSTPAAPTPGTDAYNWSGATNPADMRTVNMDLTPTYFTQEWIVQGSIEQDLGGGLQLKVGGNYQKVDIDSSQDYNLSVQNRALYAPALGALQASNTNPYLAPVYAALTPNGASGVLCTSLAEETGTGAFGGHRICSNTPQDLDHPNQTR